MGFTVDFDAGDQRVVAQAFELGLRDAGGEALDRGAIGVLGAQAMLAGDFGGEGAVGAMVAGVDRIVERDDDIEKAIGWRCRLGFRASHADEADRETGGEYVVFHGISPQRSVQRIDSVVAASRRESLRTTGRCNRRLMGEPNRVAAGWQGPNPGLLDERYVFLYEMGIVVHLDLA